MDDERARELLGAVVGGRQPSQREDFPALCHGRYLTALLALEAIGELADLRAARREPGETFLPDPGRHARYREALERQRRLDDRV